jgi:hypothetical protein
MNKGYVLPKCSDQKTEAACDKADLAVWLCAPLSELFILRTASIRKESTEYKTLA